MISDQALQRNAVEGSLKPVKHQKEEDVIALKSNLSRRLKDQTNAFFDGVSDGGLGAVQGAADHFSGLEDDVGTSALKACILAIGDTGVKRGAPAGVDGPAPKRKSQAALKNRMSKIQDMQLVLTDQISACSCSLQECWNSRTAVTEMLTDEEKKVPR